MDSLSNFFVNYWTYIPWFLGAFVLVAVFSYIYGGQKAAIAVLGSVFIFIIYLFGRKNERDSNQKVAKDIQKKREVEYEKIDKRKTTKSDAAKRLRNGNY